MNHINTGNGEIRYAQKLALGPYQYLKMRPPLPSEYKEAPPPLMGYGQGKQSYNSNDLLYKINRGETKLVRSICEVNNFQYTESHEWNLLWSSSSCKASLYEGLNEY